MRQPTIARDSERRVAGVIDTFSAGYTTVNRHPWIMAIPVLLDLFFWLGPHLSLAPLVQRMVAVMPIPADLPAEALQTYQDARDGLLQAGEGFNILSLLANHFPGIPSLMANKNGVGTTVLLSSLQPVFVVAVLAPIVGILLASVYYTLVGRQVGWLNDRPIALVSRIAGTWIKVIAFVLMVLLVGLLVGIPLIGLSVLASAVSVSLLGFVGAAVWVAILWLQFYLFFVVEAIVLEGVGPIQAAKHSILVVRFNMGPALGFVVLTWVIMLGMPIIWDTLTQSLAGTALGILGNAYISTGLAAASMIFYRERLSLLISQRPAVTGATIDREA